LLGHILVLFNAAVYVAAIPKAAGALGVAPSFGTWAQTYFMMGWALAVPLANWWGVRFGRGRVLMAGLAGFFLASLVGAFAREFPVFLFGRLLLGFPAGLVLLLTNAVASSQWPSHSRPIFAVLWGMAGLAPLTLGGAFGGWLIDEWGWRWLFYLNLPLAACVLLALARFLPGMGGGSVWRFDWVGYLLLLVRSFRPWGLARSVPVAHGAGGDFPGAFLCAADGADYDRRSTPASPAGVGTGQYPPPGRWFLGDLQHGCDRLFPHGVSSAQSS